MADLSDNTVQSLQRAITELTRTIETSSTLSAGGGSSSGGAASRAKNPLEAQQEEYRKTILRGQRTLSQFSKHIADASSAMMDAVKIDDAASAQAQLASAKANAAYQAMADNYKDASGVIGDLKMRMRELGGKNLAQASTMAKSLAASMSDSSSTTIKNVRAATMLHAAQLLEINQIEDQNRQLEYRAKLENELNNQLAGNAKLFDSLGMLDAATGKLRDNLELQELADFRLNLGEISASMVNAAEMIGASNFDQVIAQAKETTGEGVTAARGAMIAFAKELDAKDLLGDFIASLDPSKVDVFTTTVQEADGSFKRVLKPVEELKVALASSNGDVDIFATGLSVASTNAKNLARATDNVRKQYVGATAELKNNLTSLTKLREKVDGLASSATIAANAMKSWQALKKTFDDMKSFNIAQVASSFMNAQLMSIGMGMSFEETTKILQENGRILAQIGPEAMRDGLTNFEETFEKFGYNMSQAAELVGPAVESALYTGIDTKNMAQLDNHIKETMTSFSKISTVAGITAKEYMNLNAELFRSEGAFNTLVGMDKQRRKAYADEIVARRDMYIQQGLTIQQSQELIKAQVAAARAPARERLKGAAMSMMRAQMAGLSPEDAMKMFKIGQKHETARTSTEQAEFQRLNQQVGVGLEQKLQEAGASGGPTMHLEVFMEKTAGVNSQLEEFGKQTQMATDAGKGMTDRMVEMAAKMGMGSDTIGFLGNVFNTVSSVLNNSLVVAAGFGALALFGLTKAAKLASLALGGLGAGGGFMGPDRPGGKPKGRFGKLGQMARGAGGAISGALGMGATAAGSAASGIWGVAKGAGRLVSKAALPLLVASEFLDIYNMASGNIDTSKMPEGSDMLSISRWAGFAGNKMGLWGGEDKPIATPASSTGSAITTPDKHDVPTAVNTSSTTDAQKVNTGPLEVKDAVIATKMETLIFHMTEAVALLQKIGSHNEHIDLALSPGAEKRALKAQQIPSTKEYLTGSMTT